MCKRSVPRYPPSFLFLSLPHWLLWSLKLTSVATQKDFFYPYRPRWPLFSSSPNLRVSPNSFFLSDATSTRAPPPFLSFFTDGVPARKCFEIQSDLPTQIRQWEHKYRTHPGVRYFYKHQER